MKQVTILKNEPFRIRSLRIFLENESGCPTTFGKLQYKKWSDIPEMFAFPICRMYNAHY